MNGRRKDIFFYPVVLKPLQNKETETKSENDAENCERSAVDGIEKPASEKLQLFHEKNIIPRGGNSDQPRRILSLLISEIDDKHARLHSIFLAFSGDIDDNNSRWRFAE